VGLQSSCLVAVDGISAERQAKTGFMVVWFIRVFSGFLPEFLNSKSWEEAVSTLVVGAGDV